MRPRKGLIYGFILGMVGFFFMFIGYDGNERPTDNLQEILSTIGAVFALACLIINLVYWRCPNCHRMLPWRNAFAITHCPWCMEQLDD